jgi:hypothetical protein
MKKFWQLFFVTLIIGMAAFQDADAQIRNRQQDEENVDDLFDEDIKFKDRLWYGGNLILGFAGNSFENIFQFGITPMVGYKITDKFSIGPRAALIYEYYGVDIGTGALRSNAFEYGIGAFARYKIFRNFFGQVEYEFYSDIVGYTTQGNELTPIRRERGNAFVGGGFNSGGRIGYEILLLYNLNRASNDIAPPIQPRIGFTYKF